VSLKINSVLKRSKYFLSLVSLKSCQFDVYLPSTSRGNLSEIREETKEENMKDSVVSGSVSSEFIGEPNPREKINSP
jgi:hypothetical protein